jgi:hypothetical protein
MFTTQYSRSVTVSVLVFACLGHEWMLYLAVCIIHAAVVKLIRLTVAASMQQGKYAFHALVQ